jgi:hypothetical protein
MVQQRHDQRVPQHQSPAGRVSDRQLAKAGCKTGCSIKLARSAWGKVHRHVYQVSIDHTLWCTCLLGSACSSMVVHAVLLTGMLEGQGHMRAPVVDTTRQLSVRFMTHAHLLLHCVGLCWCADMSCRLPHLSTVSIRLDADSKGGHLDPVLALMHMQATGLQSLSLQLRTGWAGDGAVSTWALLGKMVSLTKLQLAFTDQVGCRRGCMKCYYCHCYILQDLPKHPIGSQRGS